jgi:catechol 2,3-dioxygenase-like lactoylglutathione lyase family enzyme
MSVKPHPAVRQLSRFELTTKNADGLARFYERAFDARRLATQRISSPSFMNLMDIKSGAKCVTLAIGKEIVELTEFDRPGNPYPDDRLPSDLIFQHFAIVVDDMDRAYRRLLRIPGWTPISIQGPELLPPSSGGATAFKFRDPDGHPLEFLAFPKGHEQEWWKCRCGTGIFLGIDHSAISVSGSARSIAFYTDLGFQVLSHTINKGPEQQRLDGLPGAQVEVTALASMHATPHIELLCYEPHLRQPRRSLWNNDVAATRIEFAVAGLPASEGMAVQRRCILDPDEHHLVIVSLDLRDTRHSASGEACFDSNNSVRAHKGGATP